MARARRMGTKHAPEPSLQPEAAGRVRQIPILFPAPLLNQDHQSPFHGNARSRLEEMTNDDLGFARRGRKEAHREGKSRHKAPLADPPQPVSEAVIHHVTSSYAAEGTTSLLYCAQRLGVSLSGEAIPLEVLQIDLIA